MKPFIFILAILSCGVDAGWVVKDGEVKNPVFKKAVVVVDRKPITIIRGNVVEDEIKVFIGK